jgi:hypothetical protein
MQIIWTLADLLYQCTEWVLSKTSFRVTVGTAIVCEFMSHEDLLPAFVIHVSDIKTESVW